MIKVGFIGGSGFDNIIGLKYNRDIKLSTPYGSPSSSYKIFKNNNYELYQLTRHGVNHHIPPHKVNYKANIYGFKELEVDYIIGITSVGGINKDYKIGDIVLTSNAIDFTSGRVSTFFDDKKVFHIDFTHPFCENLRAVLKYSFNKINVPIIDNCVYICTNGPRFETAAEINYFNKIGGDIVGMTLFPEASLAREMGICYANISIITNMAAGIVVGHKFTCDEVIKNSCIAENNINKVLSILLDQLLDYKSYSCKASLAGAGV